MPSSLCANCGHTLTTDIEVPTSPVSELLGGNFVSSAAQERIVHDTVSAAQAHISRIDDEITRLQQSLKHLQHKRDAFVTYANAHIALVAPVRRLPPEILSEIFLHCMGSAQRYSPTPYLDRAPLLLGKVCSRWRSISLSTPRLWASFMLTIRPKYLKTDVVLAKTWLAKAGTCPLSITLGSKGHYQNSMRPLMQVFLLYCERWYDIRLSLPPAALGSLLPAKNRLLNLQKLHIEGYFEETIRIFEHAPQLRSFSLHTAITSSIKVPWNNLQSLDMGFRKISECLELLRLTPNLEKCKMSPFGPPPHDPLPPVHLSRLRSIAINGDPSHLVIKLLMPKLHEISICSSNVQWSATLLLIPLFSRCSIRKMSFESYSIDNHPTDDEMIQLLKATPALVELNLRGRCPQRMTRSFLTQLAYRQGSEDSSPPCLVPMLHTMSVDYEPSYFDVLAFADAIQSRMASNVFKKVEIRHIPMGGTVEPFAMSRLRQLRDQGLDISVISRDKAWES